MKRCISSFVTMVPVGLFGLQMKTSPVLGVIGVRHAVQIVPVVSVSGTLVTSALAVHRILIDSVVRRSATTR